MRWDPQAEANVCVVCGRYDYPLIAGAALPPQRPPSGHAGIDFNRAKPIGARATKSGKMVSR